MDHDQELPAARRVRRGEGPRAHRRRAEERSRRRRRVLLVLGGVGALVLAVLVGPRVVDTVGPTVAGWFTGADEPATDGAPTDDAVATDDAVEDRRPTVLLVTTDDSGDEVTAVQLLSMDLDTGRGSLVLVPTEMVADVPGYGLLPVGDAGTFGDAALLELTLENQLQVAVDAHATLSRQDWAALFARTGGFEVEVRQALATPGADGTAERRFEPGAQFLDGPRLAELLTFEVDGEDELTSFSRVQQVLEGFLAAAGVDGALDAVFEDGAPMLHASDLAVVERALRAAAVDDGTRVDVLTLPVTVVGAGETRFYRLDEGRAAQFVVDALGGRSAPGTQDVAGVRLEILNGNGRVGVGAAVAEQLVPLGHTVVLTGNADDFDHPRTRILVYTDDDEVLLAAQQIVEALGVGQVERTDLPSAIVDITVLVGADYGG